MGALRMGIALGLLLAVSACGGGDDAADSSTASTTPTNGTTEPSTTSTTGPGPTTTAPDDVTETPTSTEPTTSEPPPSGTIAPPDTTEPIPTAEPTMVEVKVYFLRGERLAIAHRQVAAPVVLRGALTELLAGPTDDERVAGLSTEVPPGTTLLDVSLADGRAVVDLSRDYEAGGGTLSMTARLAQVIFTATQFDNSDRVLFWLDGEPVEFFGGEGIMLDEPQARMNVDRSFTGGVIVDTPLPGATVRSPFTVDGEGDLVEGYSALWVWRGGEQIAGPFAVTAGAWGMWDEFEVTVTLDASPGPIALVLDDGNGCTPGDPECGEPIMTVVPLVLTD